MEIIRNNKTLKIKLPPYKINIKTINNKHSKGYQYSCILPPILCSYFRINKETIKDNYEPNIVFYTYNNEIYITSLKILSDYRHISLKKQMLNKEAEIFTSKNLEIPEDIKKPLNELPTLNYNLNDNIERFYNTTAYNLTNSNNFRVTLHNKLFKDLIDNSKDNYILFTIDTHEKDILNNYGTIKIKIITGANKDD